MQTNTTFFLLLTFLIVLFFLQFLRVLFFISPPRTLYNRIRDHYRISSLLQPESILLPDTDLEDRHAIRYICNVFGQQEHNEKSKLELFYQSGHVTLQTLRYILPSCQQLNSNARLFSREGHFLAGGNMRQHRLL
jgi:hypothetical protein